MTSPPGARWLPPGRARIRARIVFGSVAATAALYRLSTYPRQFLFRPDRDVWIAQLFAWGEALAIGALAGGLFLAGVSVLRWLAKRALPDRPGLRRIAELSRCLDRRILPPCLLGLATAAASLHAWGSLHPLPRLPDGAAYLLQAKIFLAGRWTAPPAPLAEFFEQMFVFVRPFTAAKYFPGFPLILVPGLAIGLPALVPLLLSGAAGALVFVVSRRLVGPGAALIAWLLWTTHVAEYGNADAYTAEILTGALLLACWWWLEKWNENRHLRWLLLLSIAFGIGAITRPLTMLAIFLPAAVHLAFKSRGREGLRSLAVSALAAFPILAIIPLWSFETLGSVRTTPLNLYVEAFMPFDKPFANPNAPLPALPDDLRRNFERHARDAARNRFSDDPARVASGRLRIVFGDAFFGWRRLLIPFAVIGVFASGRRLWFGIAAAFSIFTFYLTYAYPITHTGYYSFELQPVLLIAAAAGLAAVVDLISGSDPGSDSVAIRAPGLWLLILGGMVIPCARDLEERRLDQLGYTEARAFLRDAIQKLPVARVVVFMTFPADQFQLGCPVENGPFLDREPIWLVRDRGTRNEDLRRIAGDRVPYSYDVRTRLLKPLL